jgi:hypothetical protein
LKNPYSAEVLGEHQQSALLESTNHVTNGEQIIATHTTNNDQSISAVASAAANTASEMSTLAIFLVLRWWKKQIIGRMWQKICIEVACGVLQYTVNLLHFYHCTIGD